MSEIIKEKLKTIKGFGTITKLEVSSLITTIESQKEEIESLRQEKAICVEDEPCRECLKKQNFSLVATIETQQKKLDYKDSINRMSVELIEDREKQIESLKAITELAVKEKEFTKVIFETLLEWSNNDISIWGKVGQHVGTPKFANIFVARNIKEMIERLQNG